jgi:ABC-type transport system involved in multi-copper enzyme maturation permease subunit
MRLLFSSVRKLRRRPATWISLGLLVGLLFLVFLAVGATAQQIPEQPGEAAASLIVTFPGAYDFVLSFILGLGGLLAVLYAGAIAGSEWGWGTFKAMVARGESRSRYLLATYAGIGLVLGIGLLLSFAAGVAAALIGALFAGVPTDGLSDGEALAGLPELLLRGWLSLVEQGALGFAIATLARSQIAGIGVGIGVYFGEQFASIFIPDVVKFLPFHAAAAVVEVSGAVSVDGGGGPNGLIESLGPNEALAVVALWLLGALGVTALIAERAEIAG